MIDLEEQCFLNRKNPLNIGPLSMHHIPNSCPNDPQAVKFGSSRSALVRVGRVNSASKGATLPSTAHQFIWLVPLEAPQFNLITNCHMQSRWCHLMPGTRSQKLITLWFLQWKHTISCLSLLMTGNRRQGGFRGNPSHQNHAHGEQTCGCQGGGERSGMNWEFGVSRCKLLHLEWKNNDILLCSPGNYIQSLAMEHDGG